MGSSNNTWIEPIGYTSSFRPIRTPLRLNYGRNDAKFKEARGQQGARGRHYRGQQETRKRSRVRESTPRTFPMELRPREVPSPQVAVTPTKKSKYSRSRSVSREVPKPYHNQGRPSTPRVNHNQVRFLEPLPKATQPFLKSILKNSSSRPLTSSGYLHSSSPSAPKRQSSPYKTSSQSTPKRPLSHYKDSSQRPPNRRSSGYRHSSPFYQPETDKFSSRSQSVGRDYTSKKDSKSSDFKSERRPRKRNSSPGPLNSRCYNNDDEETPRRFLRSHSEPPRRSARIANLQKKKDSPQEEKNDRRSSRSRRSRSRSVSRAKTDISPQKRHSESKYKTSRPQYRSSSVTPSSYRPSSSLSLRESPNKATRKEKRPRRFSVSQEENSRIPRNEINEPNNDPNVGYNQPADWISPAMDLGQSPPVPPERYQDFYVSYEQTVDNRVQAIPSNAIDDYSEYNQPPDMYQVRPAPYFPNNEYLPHYGPPLTGQGFDSPHNPRQGFDALVPFHRRQMDANPNANPQRQMDIYDPSNSILDLSPTAGFSQVETLSWPNTYNDVLLPSEHSRYQISSWQAAYNERLLMQNNIWNNNLFTTTQILCPDGGLFCVNENFYYLNRRVPMNNENQI